MIKNWIVATYKINEVKRLEKNLSLQKFKYYLPKITTKKINSNAKTEILFPGYIFVNISLENYSALKYTRGIKDILKLGDKISIVSEEEIIAIQKVEEESKINPLALSLKIGQDVLISKGSLKGNIVKVCSLPSRERVLILLSILGSIRKVSVPEKDLLF